MRVAQKRVDILLYSKTVKEALKTRFKELDLLYGDIISDARERGNKTISMANLSIYFNYDRPMLGGITSTNLMWLCIRYGIDINIDVKWPLKEYDENKCITNLKRLFG